MKFFLGFGMILLLVMSCSTLKWKRKYATSKFLSFQKKYFKDNQFTMSRYGEDTFENKSFKTIRKKGFKRNLRLMERSIALVPDSTFLNSVEIDSFYKNPNKIHFILNRKLKTTNIHFYK